jgi:hypothetical protein
MTPYRRAEIQRSFGGTWCLHLIHSHTPHTRKVKGKRLPQHAELAQGIPGRLRPRIFLTFGIARVVGRQPYAPAAFTQGEIPGTHF